MTEWDGLDGMDCVGSLGEISSDLYRTKNMMSKLISRNSLTSVGNISWFSTPIEETELGNSYLDLPKILWDFQMS